MITWSEGCCESIFLTEHQTTSQTRYLAGLINNCPHFRSERRFLSLVRIMLGVRNELAHYRPITLNDFEGMLREIRQTQRGLQIPFLY